MVFPDDVSDVVLTEDVIKKRREFFPTFREWVADGNADQIIRSRTSEGTLFSVPSNFTLFITSAWLSANVVLGGTFSNMNISNRVSFLGVDCPADQVSSTTANYSMPIIAHEGEDIIIGTGGVNTTRGGFAGFLLPKKISVR